MQGIPGILESMKVVQVHSLGGALNAVIHRLSDEYRESFDKTRWVLFESVCGKSVVKIWLLEIKDGQADTYTAIPGVIGFSAQFIWDCFDLSP
jgi:hypothetical protein